MLARAANYAKNFAVRAAFLPAGRRGLRYLGSDYGGWHVPAVDPSWVCCTAGIGEDATFDVELARLGCAVVAIDPTPRAIAYMQSILKEHPSIRLAAYAVWTEATELEFFPPADPEHVSFSATNLQATRNPIRVRAKPLHAILAEYGFDHAELLKLDIEGAEYRVLQTTDLDQLGVQVLCVEFHFDEGGIARMIRAIRGIERRGFRAARISQTDVTFLRR